MKKALFSLVGLLCVMVMVSCSNNSPKDVANTWLNGFYHMDYDAAKKVSTEETKALLSQLQQLSSMVPDSSKKEMKKIVVTIKDVKEEGDNATVSYTTSADSASHKDDVLKLVKQDKKWLVQFSKSDTVDPNAGDDQQGGLDSTGAAPADTSSAAMPDTATSRQ